ncbi:MAG: hypothetical protein E1N59_626 [Puniceicoccaceae bacterium 5H]|nr:MAG: hypothetical protein E1N59_626 [Puniceicoccaceae bacterium 5H]
MTFDVGWNRRDDDTGKRVHLTFKLVRQDASWIIHRTRHEPREPHSPDERDWEDLFELLDRHLARGKVSHTDYAIVKKLHDRWQQGLK